MQLSDFWNNLVHCQVYIIDPWAAPFSSYLKTVVSVICPGMQPFPSIGRCVFGPCFICVGQSCPCHLRLCVMVWMSVRAEVAVEVLAIGKLAGKLSRPGLGSFGLNDWKIFSFSFLFWCQSSLCCGTPHLWPTNLGRNPSGLLICLARHCDLLIRTKDGERKC